MKIKFLFDYLSPFSYFSWKKLPELQQRLNLKIDIVPVLFAGLLNHWGQKGPAEIPSKSRYIFTQCLRYAAKNNILFTRPLYHPFNPLPSLRLSLPEIFGGNQWDVVDAIWRAGWQDGKDIGNKSVLADIIEKLGLSSQILLKKTEDIQVKDKLRKNTSEAIELGVFGVPSFITEDHTLFWGLDSMSDLEAYLEGKENLDKVKLEEILNRDSVALRR